MNLEKETFLRVLKGAPLSVLLSLWVHGGMDRKAIMLKTGWKKEAVDDALAFLSDLDLVARPHYRHWALGDGFKHLPFPNLLPESPKNGLSGLIVETAESPKNGTSATALAAESPKNGTSGATSDQIRSDDEEENVDKLLPAHFGMSLHLLESIGMGGACVERMAAHKPFEVLGAWWYLVAGGWAKNPKAVLRSHLLNGKRTPRGYLELAGWWLEHVDKHEQLETAVVDGGHVEGLSGAGLIAAGELYEARRGFRL